MSILTYDNPSTMYRECWQNGKVIWACSFDLLLGSRLSIPPKHFFFGANIGPWKTGQMVGNPEAMKPNTDGREDDLARIKKQDPSVTTRNLRAIAVQESEAPMKRCNLEETPGGGLALCRGDHERCESCDWEYFLPSERVTELEAKLKSWEDGCACTDKSRADVLALRTRTAELDLIIDTKESEIKARGERIKELEEMVSPLNTCDLSDFIGPVKPCPFCGSISLERDGFEEHIVCKNCGGSAPVGGWQFRAPINPIN